MEKIEICRKVCSVNGNKPDEHGNINITTDASPFNRLLNVTQHPDATSIEDYFEHDEECGHLEFDCFAHNSTQKVIGYPKMRFVWGRQALVQGENVIINIGECKKFLHAQITARHPGTHHDDNNECHIRSMTVENGEGLLSVAHSEMLDGSSENREIAYFAIIIV